MPKLTKEIVDALEPGELAWCGETRGFGCRRQKSDKRVYVFKYRFRGRQRWVTIGAHGPLTVESARKKAKKLVGQVLDGQDPAERRDEEKRLGTVKEMVELFLEEHAEAKLKASTHEVYKYALEKHVIPRFGTKRVDSLSRKDITKLHKDLSETPRNANHIVSILSKMWRWGQLRGLVPEGLANPASGIERYREIHRERMLSPAELARLGQALRDAEQSGTASKSVVAALRLLIFTGARLNEILSCRWDWVDMEAGVIRLPDSKTGKKVVHLNAPALKVLQGIEPEEENPFVITGQRKKAHMVNLRKPWLEIRKAAKLEDVRIHDLRHAFASVGVASGNSLPLIGALLGHTRAETTKRYAHFQNDPLKEASDAIAKRIADAMEGKLGADESQDN